MILLAATAVDRENCRKYFTVAVAVAVGIVYFFFLCWRVYYFSDLQISPFYKKIGVDRLSSLVSPALKFYQYLVHTDLIYISVFIPIVLSHLIIQASRERKLVVVLSVAIMAFLVWFSSNFGSKPYERQYVAILGPLVILSIIGLTIVFQKFKQWQKFLLCVYLIFSVAMTSWQPEVIRRGKVWPNPVHLAYQKIDELESNIFKAITYATKNEHSYPELEDKLERQHGRAQNENLQAMTGLFVRNNFPENITIIHDQMGQTPYFAGSQYTFIDGYGLTDRSFGMSYFNQREKNSSVMAAYTSILGVLTNDTKRGFSLDVTVQDNVKKIIVASPEIIMQLARSNPNSQYDSMAILTQLKSTEWFKNNYRLAYSIGTWGLLKIHVRNDIKVSREPVVSKNSQVLFNEKAFLKN